MTRISHGCTCVHLFGNSLPPPSPSHPPGLSQCTGFECPVSCIELGLVICFIYGDIHVSMLFFQIITPSPSRTKSKSLFFTSVSLLPSCIQGHRFWMLTSCISGLGRLPASAFYSLTGGVQDCQMGVPRARSIAAIVLVTQSCPTLCNPMDQSPPGSSLSMGFPRQECWRGLLFPSPGDLP